MSIKARIGAFAVGAAIMGGTYAAFGLGGTVWLLVALVAIDTAARWWEDRL